MCRKQGQGAFIAVMIIAIATICAVSVWMGSPGVDARIPPKLVKAVNGAGKALYAGRYSYSVAPIPQHISVQANVARKEVHLPPRLRKKRRPPPRRPQYASQYQEYTRSPSRKKLRPRSHPKPRPKPRPHYREEYYDDEEIEDEPDYDYEGRPKKIYRDSHKEGKDDDFVGLHSEYYTPGYNPGRKKLKYRDDEIHYADQSSSVYIKRPKPNIKSWTSVMRPSSKLYSAAIGGHPRPIVPREEEIDDEEEERVRYREKRYRKRYRNEESYHDDDFSSKEKEDQEDYFNPDNVYHDRTYNAKQKRRDRGAEDKEEERRETFRIEDAMPQRKKQDWKSKEEARKISETRLPSWRTEPEIKDEREEQTRWWQKPEWEGQEGRPILPILQRDPLEGWGTGEKTEQSKQEELWTQGPIQNLRWTESSSSSGHSHVPLSTPTPAVQQHTIALFQTPVPVRQERWPETPPTANYRWKDPQTISTPKPKKRKSHKSGEQRTRNTNKYENQSGENRKDIIAQRVVGDALKWNSQDDRDNKEWKVQGFRQTITKPTENFDDENFNSETDGEIIYGSRIPDTQNQKGWRKELDIGFGQGMEVMVDDKVAGWQVY